MKIDIVFVLYNSEKWLKQCLSSFLQMNTSPKDLTLIFVDNGSTDGTMALLDGMKPQMMEFGFSDFIVFRNKKNAGTSRANNKGASLGKSPFLFFLNVDTEIYPDTLDELQREINNSPSGAAGWELRQLPYEHPKFYQPATKETSWSSTACFVIRRSVFEEIGGFDRHIFMYADDVDLSWRIRLAGYKILYIPKAAICHHSYENGLLLKPLQYTSSLKNNLLLRYKFGSFWDIFMGNVRYMFVLVRGNRQLRCRGTLLKNYLLLLFLLWPFLFYRARHSIRSENFRPQFFGWDYETARGGAALSCQRVSNDSPLVSILIRTCHRQDALREALCSVQNQTYPNIETVVVEDGEPQSEKMICQDFSDMNVRYLASGKHEGRSFAANRALEVARGKYLNFLDDDDLLFADHVETLVGILEESGAAVAYTTAFEVPTDTSRGFRNKKEFSRTVVFRQPFNRAKLFYQNYLPIQTVLFRKDTVGSIRFDTQMNALEDWDFWIRLALTNQFQFVDKTTSLYRVPHDAAQEEKRREILVRAEQAVKKKQETYLVQISTKELSANVSELLSASWFDKLKAKFPYLYRCCKKIIKK